MYSSQIEQHNSRHQADHNRQFTAFCQTLSGRGLDAEALINKVTELKVAVPSWALGRGGTRFGRFSIGGEPRNLAEKIEDVGLLAHYTGATDSISLHIPWDIPRDVAAIRQQLQSFGLTIDSVNSNTFQDAAGAVHSYQYGSLCHTNPSARQQAIDHNLEVISIGSSLNCDVLTVWLADGSNFPGQQDFRGAYARTQESLQRIYTGMPQDWTMLVEYKPYEPNYYSMVIPDWGTSKALCDALGNRAKVLVDLGHHLPNTNIEQIVARLLHFGSLGGFHFNGSMYGDDDLTTGSIKPFQLFLIFNELVAAGTDPELAKTSIAYMIDASHNTKDPLEDLMASLENIQIAYAKALLVDRNRLHEAQESNDVMMAEAILQDAFLTDVRPLIAEARLRSNKALRPVECFRQNNERKKRIERRGHETAATGL